MGYVPWLNSFRPLTGISLFLLMAFNVYWLIL
jgi:hypothetical protein